MLRGTGIKQSEFLELMVYIAYRTGRKLLRGTGTRLSEFLRCHGVLYKGVQKWKKIAKKNRNKTKLILRAHGEQEPEEQEQESKLVLGVCGVHYIQLE